MSTPSGDVATAPNAPIERIRGLGHWRAVRSMLRDYSPGTDTLMDQFRTMGFPLGPVARQVAGPIYFALEQGWMVRGPRGELAAVIYLRRQERDGVRVLHIDDINVAAAHRRQGLAQRLLAFAEETARRERFPYLKLACTVTNTPAVTLYRRLGFQDQHHRYFSAEAQALATHSGPAAAALRLEPLPRAAAVERSRAVFRAEREADTPETAPVMAAFYAPHVWYDALWRERIMWDGQEAGYWDGRRDKQGIAVMLGLLPELWGGEAERAVLTALAGRAGQVSAGRVTLQAMSGGHHRALLGAGAGSVAGSLAGAFGLTEQSGEQMMMVKVLAPA